MGDVVQFGRQFYVTLAFGLLGAMNWCYGLRRGGCTGHDIPMLLFFGIPALTAIATDQVQWFIAVMACIPVVLTSAPSQYWFGEYGTLYIGCLVSAVVGRALRGVFGTAINQLRRIGANDSGSRHQ